MTWSKGPGLIPGEVVTLDGRYLPNWETATVVVTQVQPADDGLILNIEPLTDADGVVLERHMPRKDQSRG